MRLEKGLARERHGKGGGGGGGGKVKYERIPIQQLQHIRTMQLVSKTFTVKLN